MNEITDKKSVRNRPLKKVRYRDQLMRFLVNPEHDVPSRRTLALEVLKLSHATHLYRYFSCDELNEILDEALQMRRKQYAADLARIDQGLLRRAAAGDPAAAKLCYMRFEGWEPGERRKVDLSAALQVAAMREILKDIGEMSRNFQDLGLEKADEDSEKTIGE